jgi:hypothetical protein
MGGEGSMMHMINSLKNNKSMLTKRKERRGIQGRFSGEKLEFENTATKEDLKQIRFNMQKEYRQKQLKVISVFSVFMLILISLFIYFF